MFMGIVVSSSIDSSHFDLSRSRNAVNQRDFTQGLVSALWALYFHFVFRHLNAKEDYRLFKFWMKLTLELPVKSERDYRVAGMSKEENKQFWLRENHINTICYRVVNWYTFILCLMFSFQLFLVKLSAALSGVLVKGGPYHERIRSLHSWKRDLTVLTFRFDRVDISSTYILFQAFHVIQTSHASFSFIHCFFSVNLYCLTCMRFFTKRFRGIRRRLERMCSPRMTNPIHRRKLAKMFVEYNQVHQDLLLINEFFNSYIGFNSISFFSIGLLSTFVILLDIDWMWVNSIY